MNIEGRNRPQALIFDMDGTLFKTDTLLEVVHPRVFATLREEGLYTGEMPPLDHLLACLGMLLDDLWRKLMPESSLAARERADELLLQYELEELEAGHGSLYGGVEETLRELKARGCKLFVASNGLEHYVKGVAEHKGIASLFDGIYSAGEYDTSSKVDLVARLLNEHKLEPSPGIWMVGDRSSDVEAGKSNGLTAVACAYATYGKAAELEGADIFISAFTELASVV